METDDQNSEHNRKEQIDLSWFYSSLPSYGKLMGCLGTLSFVLSPFKVHPPGQSLISRVIFFLRDAQTFVKALQFLVLKHAHSRVEVKNKETHALASQQFTFHTRLFTSISDSLIQWPSWCNIPLLLLYFPVILHVLNHVFKISFPSKQLFFF